MEPKHQRDEHNHAGASDFQHLIWVCWLSPVWYNVLDLIAINFNWSNRPWNFVQREISSTKLHKPLLTHLINYSTFSIYCIFLYLSFYLSWNNKHNRPKLLLFFLPSSVLKWLHKNSPILFFLTQLIWQLLQYNLTTLLTKHY